MGPFPHHRSSSLYTRVESLQKLAEMIQNDMAPTWHVKWIMFNGLLESRLFLFQKKRIFRERKT